MPTLCITAFSCSGKVSMLGHLSQFKRQEGFLIRQIKRGLNSLKDKWLLDSWQDIDIKDIHIIQLIMNISPLIYV